MNIFTITAALLALVLLPVLTATIVVLRQDAASARRDDRWLGLHR